jgi:hypothetical protein
VRCTPPPAHGKRALPADEVLPEVLCVVYCTISGHLLASAGVRRAAGHTGAATLIQRFVSALNLNVHFHMIFADGVYVTEVSGRVSAGRAHTVHWR